jgi:hypothetical protein
MNDNTQLYGQHIPSKKRGCYNSIDEQLPNFSELTSTLSPTSIADFSEDEWTVQQRLHSNVNRSALSPKRVHFALPSFPLMVQPTSPLDAFPTKSTSSPQYDFSPVMCTYYIRPPYTMEDTNSAWLSRKEYEIIREDIRAHVMAYNRYYQHLVRQGLHPSPQCHGTKWFPTDSPWMNQDSDDENEGNYRSPSSSSSSSSSCSIRGLERQILSTVDPMSIRKSRKHIKFVVKSYHAHKDHYFYYHLLLQEESNHYQQQQRHQQQQQQQQLQHQYHNQQGVQYPAVKNFCCTIESLNDTVRDISISMSYDDLVRASDIGKADYCAISSCKIPVECLE